MKQLPPNIHKSWHEHLQPLFDDAKMEMIKTKILPNCHYYPDRHYIFRVFEMPMDKIRVVLLGQDPYPNGQATGLAFGINMSTQAMPPSLKIIKKEVDGNTELKFYKRSEDFPWRTLEHWWKQGVFLLNSALTVEAKNADSHTGVWQWFSREVVKIISREKEVIWMLWGAKAKGFNDFILGSKTILKNNATEIPNNTIHYVLEGNHPAAETYPNSKYLFTGCNHFNLVNEILKIKKQSLIKW
jgi:uracil-DNA glycosylase